MVVLVVDINYGGDCLFMSEFQQVAVDDYLANFPETPHHILCDIKDVTGKQIMEMTGLKVGELDILMVVHHVHLFLCLVQNKKVGVKKNCVWNKTEKHRRFDMGTNSHCKRDATKSNRL